GLARQEAGVQLNDLIEPDLVTLSFEVRGRKPSERLFRYAVQALAERKIAPDEVLHVGSRLAQDVVPAQRAGLRTALLVGDKAALQTPTDDLKRNLKDPASRPDVLLTELDQVGEVVG